VVNGQKNLTTVHRPLSRKGKWQPLVIAFELGYISEQEAKDIKQRVIELRKMLYSLINHLPS